MFRRWSVPQSSWHLAIIFPIGLDCKAALRARSRSFCWVLGAFAIKARVASGLRNLLLSPRFGCPAGVRRNTLSRQATRALVGAGVVAGGVSAAAAASAAASAGGFASLAGVTSAAMIPRGIRQIHSTLKMVEVAVGVATVIGMLSDVVSLKVTRAQS